MEKLNNGQFIFHHWWCVVVNKYSPNKSHPLISLESCSNKKITSNLIPHVGLICQGPISQIFQAFCHSYNIFKTFQAYITIINIKWLFATFLPEKNVITRSISLLKSLKIDTNRFFWMPRFFGWRNKSFYETGNAKLA